MRERRKSAGLKKLREETRPRETDDRYVYKVGIYSNEGVSVSTLSLSLQARSSERVKTRERKIKTRASHSQPSSGAKTQSVAVINGSFCLFFSMRLYFHVLYLKKKKKKKRKRAFFFFFYLLSLLFLRFISLLVSTISVVVEAKAQRRFVIRTSMLCVQ